MPTACTEGEIAKWTYDSGNNPDWNVEMTSNADGRPIRKSLRRKLTNGDPFDQMASFSNSDHSPVYTINFIGAASYYIKSLSGQFFTECDGNHVMINAYNNGILVNSQV